MEEFLSSNGVQYEHHDLATDTEAREYLDSRGIKSVPVTIVDDDEVIIGYYPRKLVPALSLNIKVDLSGKTNWLADKYDRILGAMVLTTRQLTDAQLKEQVPWRPQSLRDLILHVLSFPELAWLSHKHGSMSTEDMRASNERLMGVATVEAIAAYGEGVRGHIKEFLATDDTEAFDLARIGPKLEHDPLFPERANIPLAQVTSRTTIRARVWERGTGMTAACGSAACAALVAAARRGLTERRGTVHLTGGDLQIEWRGDGHVLMTGPVATSFTGAFDLDALRNGAAA